MALTILIIAFIGIIVAATASISLPELPSQLSTYLSAFFYYIGKASDIVFLFVPKTITIALISTAIFLRIAVWLYRVILWVLRKIPMAGIE